MKILIIGGISLPPLNEKLKNNININEKLFSNSFHNHPWVYNLSKGLVSINNGEIHIVSITNLVCKTYNFTMEDIHYHLIPSENRIINAISLFFFEIQKLKKIIKQIKPDIIHVQTRGFEALAALQTKYPVVVTNHGQIKEHYNALGKKDIRYFIFKLFESWINKKIKFCIGVSPNCTNNCLNFIPKSHVFLIENAINTEFFKKRELEDNNTIIFTGSITPLKQVKELVLAVSRVEKCTLKLIYQGYTPSYFEEIKKLITNLKMENRVVFLGQKNQIELAEEIAKCTGLCLPSTYESFGMVLAEAMAVGKPVISSNLEGPAFIVKHNYNGLLFESGNVEELTQCISKFINDKEFTSKLASNAKQDAYKRFSPESVAKRTFKVYQKILSL